MDRRQLKTRKAIFQAFNRLLEKKHFNNITVQEIFSHMNFIRRHPMISLHPTTVCRKRSLICSII